MNVRIMTMDDYETVYKLWTNTAGMGLRSLDDSYAGIEKLLRRNPSTSFVAEVEGELVGVTLSGHDGRRGYIYHTAVKQEFRGRGIGRALIQAVCTAMSQEGINKIALVVFKTNDLGNGFWRNEGWELRQELNFYTLSLNSQNT